VPSLARRLNMTEAGWDFTVDLYPTGVFLCSKREARRMMAGGLSRVVW
jgi:hypothetical protein